MSTIKFTLHLFYDAYIEWSHDRAARLGAALAYYALFSIAPLLVIMITLAGRHVRRRRVFDLGGRELRSDALPGLG